MPNKQNCILPTQHQISSNLIKKFFFDICDLKCLIHVKKIRFGKNEKVNHEKMIIVQIFFFFSFIINFGFCRNFIFLYKKMFEDFYNYLLFLFVPLSNKKMRRREISFSSFYFLLLVHISIIVNIFMNTFQYLIFERRARCRNLQMLL